MFAHTYLCYHVDIDSENASYESTLKFKCADFVVRQSRLAWWEVWSPMCSITDVFPLKQCTGV